MLSLSDSKNYYLYRGNTDMRKSFDGLCGLVRNKFLKEPLGGDIFIFLSRRRNQIRLLLWEGDGFALYSKRLERGTFQVPSSGTDHINISSEQLLFILKGIKLESVEKRKRFSLVKS